MADSRPDEEKRPTPRRRPRRAAPAETPRPDDPLGCPEFYLNRELALLEYQRRVLAQAQDARLPLLERLRFLTICSSNLDEFFEIRVAGLKQQIEFGLEQPSLDGRTPARTLEDIGTSARDLVREQYRVLHEELLPRLAAEGIRMLGPQDWSKRQAEWSERYFENQVLPVLTPVALDPAHPFPRVQNKSLNFIVHVAGADAFGRDVHLAVVQVPRSLPRVIPIPDEACQGYKGFALLSALVQAHMGRVLPGLEILGCHAFRVTRNSDIELDEEEVDNLLKALSSQLTRRRFSFPVRLEVAEGCTPDLEQYLLENFELEAADLYRVRSPVNLHRLDALADLVPRADLKFRAFAPGVPPVLAEGEDLFAAIRKEDRLLHHPYESFEPVVRLLEQAADDPAVLAIKMTLYRVGKDSPVVAALARAARAGKEVTAVVELRARFDEERNIDLANLLQDAGAHVVYGVVGFKTHAKLLLIVRRESGKLRRYAHLGTGNYHHVTTKTYSDLGLLTTDKAMTEDVHHVFQQLTGLGLAPRMRKVLQAPSRLYPRLLELVKSEADAARRGAPARIIAKVNSLSDTGIIQALYRASQAGVRVDLIVRGICRLRPGVPGVSENIRVRSLVGRFLEHARVFWFLHGGADLLFASSADWMERNLHSRVEACFPIEHPPLKRRVIEELLNAQLRDQAQAWDLQPDGSYRRVESAGPARFSAQRAALEAHAKVKKRG
jgi:polyphosphate kinase